MRLSITHKTRYLYDQPVNYALQKVRLRPLNDTQQTVVNWGLAIEGGRFEVGYLDHFLNLTDLVSAEPGSQMLDIVASGVVETNNTSGVLGKVYGTMPLWYYTHQTPLTEPGAAIRKLARALASAPDTLDGLHDLSASILKDAPYTLGQTGSATLAEDALKSGHGVCQDHAQIFVSAARAAGHPARYISGYLMMNDRVDQDASHAWAEVHTDALGWVGFDVSNGISPDERYVRVATGLDSQDAAPISGLRMGTADEEMIVSVQVQQ